MKGSVATLFSSLSKQSRMVTYCSLALLLALLLCLPSMYVADFHDHTLMTCATAEIEANLLLPKKRRGLCSQRHELRVQTTRL